ncbi:MAG TPA: AI-2E family transporter, partial [Cyclobacteriaceae bacterium]|nr:AI-2E family transporter [Cyclobacteriaceae bacterium]
MDKFFKREASYLTWLQGVVYSCIILYFGRNILVPISFAMLVSFVLYPICAWLERKGMGRMWAIVLSLTFLMVLGLLVVALLVYQFLSFFNEWPSIQEKLNQLA